jgi:hypothetical protein
VRFYDLKAQMRTSYKIILAFFILIWLAAMYLVYLVSSNPNKAFEISVTLAAILANPYFIPVFAGFVLFIVVYFSGPVWARMLVQAQLRKRLEQNGVKNMAQIIKVNDTGITINKNPRVSLTVIILNQEASFDLTVPRVAIPRVGDSIPVLYDPDNPSKAVYAGC